MQQKLIPNCSEMPPIEKRRPIPAGMMDHLKKQEELWESQGVIEDVPIEEAEYASNLCFSPKKDQVTSEIVGIRTCIDFRNINKILKSNSFPLPRQDELLTGNISRSNYFSELDLAQFFNQIPLDKESRKYCCFY